MKQVNKLTAFKTKLANAFKVHGVAGVLWRALRLPFLYLKQKEISKTVILQSDSLDSVKKEVVSEIKGQKTAVKTLDEIQNATNDWQAKLITYDTKQPIDKTSGKPPVLSQLEITNISKSNQSAHTSELIKDDFSYRYQSEIDS